MTASFTKALIWGAGVVHVLWGKSKFPPCRKRRDKGGAAGRSRSSPGSVA